MVELRALKEMTGPLDEIRTLGLPLTWATVRAGWRGIGAFGRQLTAEDIEAFACGQIGHASDADLPDVAELCAGVHEREHDIASALARLAPTIPDHVRRTWRIFLLWRMMRDLPERPLFGLFELSAFWLALDLPADMPPNAVIEFPPPDYTQENYRRQRDLHEAWLRAELADLAECR